MALPTSSSAPRKISSRMQAGRHSWKVKAALSDCIGSRPGYYLRDLLMFALAFPAATCWD
jgi:hypothetical protein